jgi:hypothetical protein
VRFFLGYIATESESVVALPEAAESPLNETTLVGNGHSDIAKRLQLQPSEVSSLVYGSRSLQLGGKVTYTDVFGGNRTTAFRFVIKKISCTTQGSPEENFED